MFTTIKFLRILKKKGLAPSIPEDLFFFVKKGMSTQLSIEEPVEPDCTKYGASSTGAVFRLGIRELVWKWLDTESRLKIVAIGKDPRLQAGLDFGTSETMYMLSILQSVEVDLQNYESVSWYLPVPSSVSSTSGSSVSSWTLFRLSAGLLIICEAPARRPRWSVRCIRVATGCSRIFDTRRTTCAGMI